MARPPSLLDSPAMPIPSSSHVHFSAPSSSSSSSLSLSSSPRASIDHPLRSPAGPLSPLDSPSSPSPKQTHELLPRFPPAPPLLPPARGRPQGIRIPDRFKPWFGIGSWAVTSLGFLLAIAFWKKEVFTGLDQLALYLQSLGYTGYAILFCLIFITTIPPFPLYSTLIILSGYTYGTWTGAAISYLAALSGAVIVFLLSRHFLRESMARLLTHTVSLQRVVRAIERRPKLLLLIRIAPYPYNVMNVLLAASHALPFRTYFTCTALSLFKVMIHTSLGASMHSFSHTEETGDGDEGGDKTVGRRMWTVAGLILCFGILVYLAYVARRAVDDEMEGVADSAAWDGRDVEECAVGAEEMREVVAVVPSR